MMAATVVTAMTSANFLATILTPPQECPRWLAVTIDNAASRGTRTAAQPRLRASKAAGDLAQYEAIRRELFEAYASAAGAPLASLAVGGGSHVTMTVTVLVAVSAYAASCGGRTIRGLPY
jgi:hypothetical protein